MAGSVPTLYWFDRWDERIGLLRVVGELVHTEKLNGEDTLEFSSYEVPTKGDRLLWLDGSTWREHVVVRTDEPVAGLCSVYAESSLCELLDDFIEEAQLVSRTGGAGPGCRAGADSLVGGLLRVARHRRGADLPPETRCGRFGALPRCGGGEVTPIITVAGGRVASRSIRLDAPARGLARAPLHLRQEHGRVHAHGARAGTCTRPSTASGRACPSPTRTATTRRAIGAS